MSAPACSICEAPCPSSRVWKEQRASLHKLLPDKLSTNVKLSELFDVQLEPDTTQFICCVCFASVRKFHRLQSELLAEERELRNRLTTRSYIGKLMLANRPQRQPSPPVSQVQTQKRPHTKNKRKRRSSEPVNEMASNGGGMQRWAGRVALVTGASSGIGQSTAKALVRHGMKVIGCARNVETIEEDARDLSGDSSITGSLHAITCDLTKEDQILEMFAEIKEKFGGVDACICNAGVNHAGSMASPLSFLNGDTAKWKDMLEVNVLAVAICCREAVKQMEEKGALDGQLLVTNSLSGHRLTGKDVHVYAATKHAVTAMVEAIRRELREKKNHIRIAQISPGVVETEFRERMYPNETLDKARKLYTTMEPLSADDIADSMLYVLGAPPHVQVHDILIRPTEQRT